MKGDRHHSAVRHREYFLAAFLLVAGLVLLECGVRFFVWSPRTTLRHRRYGSIERPLTTRVHSREGWSSARTNNMGLFDDDDVVSKADGLHRTLLLGDSMSAGIHVNRNKTFATGLEKALPSLQVINAAHPGWTPVSSLAFADDYGDILRPDSIILQLGDRDLDEVTGNVCPCLDWTGTGWMFREADISRSPLERLLDTLRDHSGFVTFLAARGRMLVQAQKERLQDKFAAQQDRRLTHAGVSQQPAHACAAGVPPQAGPVLDEIVERMGQRVPTLVVLYLGELEHATNHCAARCPDRVEWIHAWARRNDLELVDPSAALCAHFLRTRQPTTGFHNSRLGEGHLNESGHAIVATELRKALEDLLTR